MRILKLTLLTLLILLASACNRNQRLFGNNTEDIDTISVFSVDKMTEISGTDGNMSTTIYYLVSTSKGAYRIDIGGIFANPQLVGVVRSNRTYIVQTMWFDAPVLHEYKRITKVIKEL